MMWLVNCEMELRVCMLIVWSGTVKWDGGECFRIDSCVRHECPLGFE